MDTYQNQPLTNCCKTILLKRSDIFVSAFPGKIVFGTISDHSYIKFKYFQFLAFDVVYLYLSLVTVIKKVFSEENVESNCDGVIIKLNDDLQYLWSISQSTENINKHLHILLEFKSNLIYQVEFNLEQLNDFVNGLSETFIPCLNLKNVERYFFDFISKQQISDIVQLTTENGLTLLNQFKFESHLEEINSINQINLIEIVVYYKELILLYKKIKSLIRPIDTTSRIDAILLA